MDKKENLMKISKKIHFLVFLPLLTFFIVGPLYSKTESKPQESQPESHPRSSPSLLQQAMTLLEIYGKIKRLVGADDQSGLQTQLDRLNDILDQLLDFKESLTPQKKARIEEQLNLVKKDIKGFSNIETTHLRKQFLKLSDSLITLVNIIMERNPQNQM